MNDKTEKATPRRIEEARREGNIVRSERFQAGLATLLAAAALALALPALFSQFWVLVWQATEPRWLAGPSDHLARVTQAALWPFLMQATGAIALIAVVSALPPALLQSRFVVSVRRATPDPSRLDPAATFKQMFAPRQLADVAANLALVIVLSGAIHWLAVRELGRIPATSSLQSLPALSRWLGRSSMETLLVGAAAVLPVGLLDLGLQHLLWLRQLRMSKQELRDEHRQTEGDPHIRAMQRSRRREEH